MWYRKHTAHMGKCPYMPHKYMLFTWVNGNRKTYIAAGEQLRSGKQKSNRRSIDINFPNNPLVTEVFFKFHFEGEKSSAMAIYVYFVDHSVGCAFGFLRLILLVFFLSSVPLEYLGTCIIILNVYYTCSFLNRITYILTKVHTRVLSLYKFGVFLEIAV